MRKKRSTLADEEVKSRIGELYLGLKPIKPGIVNHASIFMLRRSLFIAITFALFFYPGIQIQVMIYMTLIQIIYLGYAGVYEHASDKTLETLNESVFILI